LNEDQVRKEIEKETLRLNDATFLAGFHGSKLLFALVLDKDHYSSLEYL